MTETAGKMTKSPSQTGSIRRARRGGHDMTLEIGQSLAIMDDGRLAVGWQVTENPPTRTRRWQSRFEGVDIPLALPFFLRQTMSIPASNSMLLGTTLTLAMAFAVAALAQESVTSKSTPPAVPTIPKAEGFPANYKGTPYKGIAQEIPGRVELENFDEGGLNVGFTSQHHEGNSSGKDYRAGVKPQICVTNDAPSEQDRFVDGKRYPSNDKQLLLHRLRPPRRLGQVYGERQEGRRLPRQHEAANEIKKMTSPELQRRKESGCEHGWHGQLPPLETPRKYLHRQAQRGVVGDEVPDRQRAAHELRLPRVRLRREGVRQPSSQYAMRPGKGVLTRVRFLNHMPLRPGGAGGLGPAPVPLRGVRGPPPMDQDDI